MVKWSWRYVRTTYVEVHNCLRRCFLLKIRVLPYNLLITYFKSKLESKQKWEGKGFLSLNGMVMLMTYILQTFIMRSATKAYVHSFWHHRRIRRKGEHHKNAHMLHILKVCPAKIKVNFEKGIFPFLPHKEFPFLTEIFVVPIF